MADVGGKKGKKKKKGKTLNLNEFLSEGGKTPVIKPVSNWGDEMEESGGSDWNSDPYGSRKQAFDVTKLPTAPKASLDSSFDASRLPSGPPYTAYIGSLPYEVTEDEIADFFVGLKLLSVRLPGGLRQKGFGYAEFEDLDSLKKALELNNEMIQNRQIKVDVAGHSSSHGSSYRDGGDQYMADPELMNYDWRKGGSQESQPQDRQWNQQQERASAPSNLDQPWGRSDRDVVRSGDSGYGFGRSQGDSFGSGRGGYGEGGYGRDDNRGYGRDSREYGSRDGGGGFGQGDRGGFRQSERGGFGQSDRGFGGGDRDSGDRGYGRSDSGYGRDDRGYGRNNGYGENGGDPTEQNWRSNKPAAPAAEIIQPSRQDDDPPEPRAAEAEPKARGNDTAESAAPKQRKRLNLKPRTAPSETQVESTSSIFGGARPVDTSTKEKEIEERLAKLKMESEFKTKPITRERHNSHSSADGDEKRQHSQHGKEGTWKSRTSSKSEEEEQVTAEVKHSTSPPKDASAKEQTAKQKRPKGTTSQVKYEEPKAPVFSKESMFSVLATDDNSDDDGSGVNEQEQE